MMPLKILFLAPRLPWPLDTGGKIRTYYLLRALSRAHKVTLLTLGSPDTEADGINQLSQLGISYEVFSPLQGIALLPSLARGSLAGIPLTIQKYQNPMLRERIHELVSNHQIDLVHCDHLHLGLYGPSTGLPFIIDEHNIETIIWDRFARDKTEPVLKRLMFYQQAMLLRRLEARLCQQAALVLLCSTTDETQLSINFPKRRFITRVTPNGVDVDYFGEPGPTELNGHLAFTGSMDWPPNENAVSAFLEDIYPLMKQRLGHIEFAIIGRNPSVQLKSKAQAQQARVTGTVADIRPYLRGALALVVPMRVGGGTRLKILEAFAAKVPVISTAVGIEGIEAIPDVHYLAAETAEQFASQAQRLKEHPELRQGLTQAAFHLARERYSWDAIGQQLAEEYARRFVSR